MKILFALAAILNLTLISSARGGDIKKVNISDASNVGWSLGTRQSKYRSR